MLQHILPTNRLHDVQVSHRADLPCLQHNSDSLSNELIHRFDVFHGHYSLATKILCRSTLLRYKKFQLENYDQTEMQKFIKY